MKKRICPICDQTMDHPFYCRTCRRLRFHSEIREIDYYLNEQHPADEKECLYHGRTEAAPVRNERKPAAGTAKQEIRKETGRTPARNKAGMGTAGGGTRAGMGKAGNRTRPGNKSLGKVIFSMAFLYVLVIICTNLLPAVLHGAEDIFSRAIPEMAAPEPESRYEDGAWDGDESWFMDDEEEAVYLSDEEVKAAGKACNSYGHLPVTCSRLEAAVDASREILGWDECSESRWSNNYAYGDYTDYTDTVVYDLYAGNALEGTVEGYFDTATGEMHGIALRFSDMESLMAGVNAVRPVLEETGSLSPETDLRALLDAALEESRSDAEESGMDDSELAVFEAGALGVVYYGYEWEGETSCELTFWAGNEAEPTGEV